MISISLKAEDVLIYSDDGAWEPGIIALENFYDYYSMSTKRIYADDINSGVIDSDCRIICFPGGYAYNYKKALTNKGLNAIRNYIDSGGAYLGICAGAYFASTEVVWEGFSYKYGLGLFQGSTVGAIDSIAEWDQYSMTKIKTIDPKFAPNDTLTNHVLYYGGPYFLSDSGFDFDTVSVWDEYNKLPAIIKFTRGNGKVLLIGPHLEIEENDSRDGTDFAGELDDIESDWNLLFNMVSWLTGNANDVSEEMNFKVHSFNIFPNPASDYFFLDAKGKNEIVTITDLYGQTTERINTSGGPGIIRIDTRDFHSGIYFIHSSINSAVLVIKK